MEQPNLHIDHDLLSRIAARAAREEQEVWAIPLFQVAAVLTEAPVAYMIRQLQYALRTEPTDEDVHRLKESSFFIERRNVIRLNDSVRNEVLRNIPSTELSRLLKFVKPFSEDRLQGLFWQYIAGYSQHLDGFGLDDLLAVQKIASWCAGSPVKVHEMELINGFIRQKELLAPLTRLTKNFKGRERELRRLEGYYRIRRFRWVRKLFGLPAVTRQPFFVTGIGGTGKSTLVAKSILGQLELDGQSVFLFLDFDRPGLSIGNVFSLAREALRQWSIQTPQFGNIFSYGIELIDTEYGATSRKVSTRLSDRQVFYDRIFTPSNLALVRASRSPVIMVFDSFEELQYRASRTEISTLMEFLQELQEFIPQLRPVFVGRSEIGSLGRSFERMPLPAFDKASAVGFLGSMGVEDKALQDYITDRFGSSPLTLKLAARLVVSQLGEIPATLENVRSRELFAAIDKELLQEELVTRNLEHIHAADERVKNIAVPGIVVRKIDADIIRFVLAGPCQLGEIDHDTAISLYQELTSESFLFDYDGSGVVFKQELRRALYPHIRNNSKYPVLAIHDAAVTYYKDKPDVEDRAEYLYHVLMRGDDPKEIRHVFIPEMRPYIEKALIELPPLAYLELAIVLGLPIPEDRLQQLTAEQWVVYLKSQLQEIIRNGEQRQLKEWMELHDKWRSRFPVEELWWEKAFVEWRLGIVLTLGTHYFTEGSEDRLKEVLQSSIFNEYLGDCERALAPLQEKMEGYPNYRLGDPVIARLTLDVCFRRLRLRSRLGLAVEQEYDHLRFLVNEVGSTLGNLPEAKSLFELLPPPYDVFFRKIWFRDGRAGGRKANTIVAEVQFFHDYIQEDRLRFLSLKSYQQVYNDIKKNNPAVADLDRYLKRNYDVFLQNIAAPGVYDVLLLDTVLYAEVNPDLASAKYYSSAKKFSAVMGKLDVEAFTENEEVARCLSRLRSYDREEKFQVSDTRDVNGHQYVDLVLQGQGSQAFALLGYTYILEEMGIRFNNIKGTGAGALQAAFLATPPSKSDNRSLQLLCEYSRIDLRKLADGILSRLLEAVLTRGWRMSANVPMVLVFAAIPILAFCSLRYHWAAGWQWSLGIYSAILFGYLFYAFYLVLFQLNRGKGINPGRELKKWIQSILEKDGIDTVSRLEERIARPVEDGPNLEKPLLEMIAAEWVTFRKINFPKMSDLFRTAGDKDPLAVAEMVHACMAIPLFFGVVPIRGIPQKSSDILNAWQKRFGISEPPPIAWLSSTSVPFVFPNQEYGRAPRLPCFGVSANRKTRGSAFRPGEKALPGFFLRLLREKEDADELNRGEVQVVYERGFTEIEIDSIRYFGVNYQLTGEEKINLFVKGAVAATNFLLEFDWLNYRYSLQTGSESRPE